jgi:hypothetical protein
VPSRSKIKHVIVRGVAMPFSLVEKTHQFNLFIEIKESWWGQTKRHIHIKNYSRKNPHFSKSVRELIIDNDSSHNS